MKLKYLEKDLPLCHLFTTEPTWTETSLGTAYVARKSLKKLLVNILPYSKGFAAVCNMR